MEFRFADLERVARYKLLTDLVYPRPIALVSTVNANSVLNAAPFSFFNVVADEPPLVMLSFNRRSDGTMKDTVRNIRRKGPIHAGRFGSPVRLDIFAYAEHPSQEPVRTAATFRFD